MKTLLQVYDLERDRAEVLGRFDGHFEAPNWHPTRDELLVNGAGRLYRVPLKDPRLIPVGTGFANRINNDHGFSPDGTTIFFTDKVATGKACIYRMPFAGGPIRRLTDKVPSYWHGGAPDGAWITYAGYREEDICQVMVAASDGRGERVLTEGFQHCDGPDFSACGRWVWFNGEKDGAVDLWRVPVGGGAPERMTEDASVNWFPHPSPDGQWVLYLAYPEGTQGHPANLEVCLRVMPAEGGPSRDLISIIGGQGSLNVPSWAPDSRRFAFASYDLA